MSIVTAGSVRAFVVNHLRTRLESGGRELTEDLPDECDLLLSGLIDSLGLLELIAALTEHYRVDLDFDDLDPEQMTILGPLCTFVAKRVSN